MKAYKDTLEHLQEELGRIELLIHSAVLRLRMMGRTADQFKSFCITEEEIDAILAGERSGTARTGKDLARHDNLRQQFDALQLRISERKAKSLRAGILLRLEQLKDLFQLTPLDIDALLICLAPEVQIKYEKLYAYLQDNLIKKRASVDLMLEVLCQDGADKLSARRRFTPAAPLISYGLLTLSSDVLERNPPLLTSSLMVDERITQYLLGSDEIDPRLSFLVRRAAPSVSWPNLILPQATKDGLENAARCFLKSATCAAKSSAPPQHLVVYFQGPAGSGKLETAAALCRELAIPLLVVDSARLLNGEHSVGVVARLVLREALIQQAALYFDRYDALLGEDHKSRECREILFEELKVLRGLTFLAGSAGAELVVSASANIVPIAFPVPPAALRNRLWQESLDGFASPNIDVAELTNRFRLTAGQMRNAVTMAKNLALWRDPANGLVSNDDLYTACRSQANPRLGALAQKIGTQHTWKDIVLPGEQMAQLQEIFNQVKYRDVVYGAWGFDRKLSSAKGLNILFSGVSGTGKTMAAKIMAHELGVDLYKIDLSAVVSKYIGETEKNLSFIFNEAQHFNAILFFDEADALFGKRSEVKDAHDRYANIEIAYLLQKMDEYDGIVILATNLRNNVDEAFTRRMQATIDFPFPEEGCRRQIFENIFPKDAPLNSDIDFAFLARQFKLTGGNIKNIAVHAAFLAAAEGKRISMAHMIRATKREFQKMARMCTKAEFGPYYDLMASSEVSVGGGV